MLWAVVLATVGLVGCSSAPAPERSAHADGPSDEPRHDEPAPAAEPAPAEAAVDDVPAAALESTEQRLGCTREEPATAGGRGVACGLLRRFGQGATPRWREGVLGGAILAPAAGAPDLARPALLAVRGEGAALEVAWAALSPDDPHDATALTAMAADVLQGHAPAAAPAPGPGLSWSRPRATRGASTALGDSVFARAEGDATIVLVWDAEAPLVAIARAAAP